MRPVLTHLALHVENVEECVAFYRDYCKLSVVRRRGPRGNQTVWLAEPGKDRTFVFVLIGGGQAQAQAPDDFSHRGFALSSKAEVDEVATRAETEGRLAWSARQQDYPVGYFCGVRDPDGGVVEFSYGQPLGPGADSEEQRALPE